MPFLIIEHRETRRGIVLNGRALIGRWASNEVVVDDPGVSRVHAWVAHAEGQRYVLTDARSRSGTRVNGQAIGEQRCTLNDGDEIRIGPSLLTFGAGDALPEGIEPVAPPAQRVDEQADIAGILFDCVCQAPLWAPHALAGQVKRCHYCRQRIVIPHNSGLSAELAPARRKSAAVAEPSSVKTCSICQWTIDPASDETAACPDCGLTFHAECWTENLGCSSYGCAQVNALAPKEDKALAEGADVLVVEPSAPAAAWDTILLAASVTASLIGVLLFGVPALIVVGAIAFYIFRGDGLRRRTVIALASAVALAGSIVGVAMSYWWWFV
jgi:hypothetical protein